MTSNPGFRRAAAAVLLLWSASMPASAQSVSDYAVRLSAVVQTNPARITLSWPADSRATSCNLYRKTRDASSWGIPTPLASNATSYVDSSVAVGSAYEYRITRPTADYTAHGYIYAGIQAPLTESRGKMLLLVDSTRAAPLATELTRLQMDLAGDGWTVLRYDLSRTDSVTNIKSVILTNYNADPANVKALFLLGHLPVPYSGLINPDGHGDHLGAWPADAYYGDMSSLWTDSSVSNATASRVENRNVPGDGKFDESTLRSDVELQVGRVDLANMPAFPESETELLRRYLNKDHHFRFKFTTAQPRGLVDDSFGTFSGEAFAASAYRNFAPFFGAANTFALDWLTTLSTQSYLWGYGAGGGSYTSAGGVGSTYNFVTNDPRVVFTMLFGSYFGDWDSQNNFMRAALGTPTYTLTCAWSGRPYWMFHHMALGETIGFGARLTQNNSSLYDANFATRSVHIGLMGDPTLRLHPVAPPQALAISTNGAGRADLAWAPSPDLVAGYHVYRANSSAGPFARLTSSLVTGTNYSDTSGTGSTYMVRAVKLESSASGSYWNASQGIFQSRSGLLGLPSLALVSPTNSSVFMAPAVVRLETSLLDPANAVRFIEFYADEVKLGEVGTPPFQLVWSNAPVGTYSLTARATWASGRTTNSAPVSVRVDAPLVAKGAVWRYLDDGSDQGAAWRDSSYSDTAWASGPAELGYSNSPVTIVNFGGDPTNKHITTYFRHTFVIEEPTAYTNLTLGVLRDDGAAVYLNGEEVFRSNLPPGPLRSTTRASAAVGGADESAFFPTNLPPALLLRGTNLLAVEVHQSAPDSSDLGFNLYLTGAGQAPPPSLSATLNTGGILLVWPASAFGYRLESTPALPPLSWASVNQPVVIEGNRCSVVVPLSDASQFFRLARP